MSPDPVPITVIAGYLGTGKTTLLHLPASVLRPKGYPSLTGDPRHRVLFQQGSDWSVRRDSPWGPDGPGCRVSLTAPAGCLDSDRLNRSIGLCVRRPPM